MGSLLGTVVAAPFFARLESEEWQRVKLPFRMLFRDEISGYYLQSPGVESLTPITGPVYSGWQWQAENLRASTKLAISRSLVMTESGRVITEKTWDQACIIEPENVIRVSHSLTSDNEALLDELVFAGLPDFPRPS